MCVGYIITWKMKNESRTIFFAVKRVQKNMQICIKNHQQRGQSDTEPRDVIVHALTGSLAYLLPLLRRIEQKIHWEHVHVMEGFRDPDNTSGVASNNNGETVQMDDKL